MTLTKLYDPANGPMRVGGLISGKGSNLVKLIEKENENYKMAVIFTDNPASNARLIGERHNIPVEVNDIKEFYAKRGKPLTDMDVRAEFDARTVELLKPYNIDMIVYAGYMKIATPTLINAFLGINVHPGNLRVLDPDGKRKFRGGKAVELAMDAKEEFISASVHIMTPEVDGGPLLMVSKPLRVDYSLSPSQNQDKLKEVGDWKIFPRTLEYISQGRYSKDKNGKIYFDNTQIPTGIKLDIIDLIS
ncbi:MAG: formyltransferase family protein [Nanoarchaeota archaeon]|nr:formyltransferase family protein [Nanoarchaeota archaeon]